MNTTTEERTDAPTAEAVAESAENIIARLKKNAKSFFSNIKQAIKNNYLNALALRELSKAKRAEKRAAKKLAKADKPDGLMKRFWRRGKKNIANTEKWVARALELMVLGVLAVSLVVTAIVAIIHAQLSVWFYSAGAREAALKSEIKRATEDRKAKRAEKKAAADLVDAAEEVDVTVVTFTADEVSEVVNGTDRSEDIDIVTRELLEKHLENLGADLERKYAAAHNGSDTKEASYLFGQLAAFYVWQQCFIKREDFSPLKAHEETLAEAAKHGYDVKVAEKGYEYGEVIAKLAESLGIEESVYAL